MTTNANIPAQSPLHHAGANLIKAAQDYWVEYQKQFARGAVVWLESDSGALILFTRAEYKRQIMEVVDDIDGDPLKEHFFEKAE